MQQTKREPVDILPWFIPAGKDGLQKDAILVGVMDGNEMVSVSLHVANPMPQDGRTR